MIEALLWPISEVTSRQQRPYSSAHRGLTFQISAPLARSAGGGRVDLSNGHPIGDCSILIVDDEPLIRFDVVDFFIDQGFQVFEAESADHAIAILEENPTIRVVLTDVQMPGSMDGLRLAHVIRERWPPAVLVIVSGGVPLTSAALPVHSAFIAKPFDPRHVLSEIERLNI